MMANAKKKYVTERNYRPVGDFLKGKRQAAGLTQREVSIALDYSSAQFISNFENGLGLPPMHKLAVMVKLYKIDPHEMLDVLQRHERTLMLKEFRSAKASL
jgi:transcriptional regulator with XRE-family HTH domain